VKLDCGLDDPGFEGQQEEEISPCSKSPAWLGVPPILLLNGEGGSFLEEKRSEHKVNNSPPSCAEAKNELSYTFTSLYTFIALETGRFTFFLNFVFFRMK